ncbi:hypothetical protein QBC34DRAFT_386485 [Podospora aff. communis PSN243]|uniref:Uncharacterized protein n=1 Tax=Podospora aff. communis PSN243 TaxID=3040156 RepID=A0AAV9G4K3_9PEZI|nr:hypothetical protein QBC34DRAFT_386485 [Podospora aff. communis PSN243]
MATNNDDPGDALSHLIWGRKKIVSDLKCLRKDFVSAMTSCGEVELAEEAELINHAFLLAGEMVSRRFLMGGIPLGVPKEIHVSYVNQEGLGRWFPRRQILESQTESSGQRVGTKPSIHYQHFLEDVRPEATKTPQSCGPEPHPEWFERQEVKITLLPFRYEKQFSAASNETLEYWKVKASAHGIDETLAHTANCLVQMRQVRASLWEELCPNDETYPGCFPWELPLPADHPRPSFDPVRDSSIRGTREMLCRAQRFFDDRDTFYLQLRPLTPEHRCERWDCKISLLLRPGITALRAPQKMALLRAWGMLKKWHALMLQRHEVDLVTFVKEFQDHELAKSVEAAADDEKKMRENAERLEAEKRLVTERREQITTRKRKALDEQRHVDIEEESLRRQEEELQQRKLLIQKKREETSNVISSLEEDVKKVEEDEKMVEAQKERSCSWVADDALRKRLRLSSDD